MVMQKFANYTQFCEENFEIRHYFDEENFEGRRGKASEGSDGVETYVERLESML